jgi:ribosome-binding protein aMBF1 (putative translation factor)
VSRLPGARLRTALALRGASEAWLAQQLAMPLAVIGAWIEDGFAPDAATAARIAALLMVREAWLMEGEGPMEAE